VRHFDYKNSTTTIDEYLMTENTPGEGFTKIDQQPSDFSDLLKDLGIKLYNKALKEFIFPLGETGYYMFVEYSS
jgi:hypothetical protein